MNTLQDTFLRGGFTFTLIKRDGDAALYSKLFTNKADSPKWFEAIKVCKDDDDNEVFPASTSWELLGKTFPEKDEAAAEAKYQELVDEYGAEALKEGAEPIGLIVTEGPIINALTDEELAQIDFGGPSKDAPVVEKKTRGRKKMDVTLTIPSSGTFQARELAAESGMSVPFVHNRLKNLLKEGLIEIHQRVPGRRGKPIILFKKKGAKV